MSRSVPHKCGIRKPSLRAGLKKNLFADLLASDVVQEIETLLGRQVVEDLDLEALELAVRQQVLQLAGAAVEQRLNADTNDERGSRTCCGCGQPARFAGRRIKQVQSVSVLCDWSALTITALVAATASVLAINTWA